MPDADVSILSMETGEVSDPDSGSDFLSQLSDMNHEPYLFELAADIYGPGVTERQIDALDEQLRRRTVELGDLELAVDEVRRDFLIRTCITSINTRLEFTTHIRKEMQAYERTAAHIRNFASQKYVKAHQKKDTNTHDWEEARADMRVALILASKSLQKLEKLCDQYEKMQIAIIYPAYELMCEPFNLEYGRVEGFHGPEPDPIAPLMGLKIKGYNNRTRLQLAKGFRYVKQYRSFMEDPKQKEMREYAKPKTEGETQSKVEDVKVEEGQGTAVPDSPTYQYVSSRSQAPSPPSRRNTPAEDLASLNLGDLFDEETSTDHGKADAE